MPGEAFNRRPIRARSAEWAKRMAASLAASSITPDQISLTSIAFAGLGAFVLAFINDAASMLFCALAIQGRLLCNLFDGMVAVEHGKGSPLGPMFNEFPDRIADTVLIAALGYAAGYPALGWIGAVLALMTAYIRAFGGSLGLPQDFRGPMAKAHRMAVMTAGCVIGAVESAMHGSRYALLTALLVIVVGSIFTCINRARVIADQLRQV